MIVLISSILFAMSSAVASVFTYPSCVIMPILANLPAATPKISCVGSQASDARYVTIGVTSSALKSFPTSSGRRASVILVYAVGAITLTLILYFAPSIAKTFVNPTIPIFAAP